MAGPQLGDLLAGAAGAPVNRPQLDAYVTQGQAMAGLRTAQTEEALGRAQQLRDEQDARDRLLTSLSNEKDAQGNPIRTSSEAAALRDVMVGHYGNAEQAEMAHKAALTSRNMEVIGNPSADPQARAAAAQANAPSAPPFNISGTGEIVDRFGRPPPMTTVQQTPGSQAKQDLETSQALLARLKAEHPEAFKNGAIDPAMLPTLIQYVRENPNAAPSGRALTTPTGAAIAAGLTNAPPGSAPANGVTPAAGVSFKEQQSIRNDFAGGKAAGQTTALNTMYLHSLLFDEIADQLHNNQFTPTNHINLLWQRVFGSAAPTNLQTAGAFLGREAVRATVNAGAGTGQERELTVPESASPEALHGAAATLRSLAGGQLRSLNNRALRGGVDITQLLDPEVVHGYGLTMHGHGRALGGNGATPAAAPGGGAPGGGPPERPPLDSFMPKPGS